MQKSYSQLNKLVAGTPLFLILKVQRMWKAKPPHWLVVFSLCSAAAHCALVPRAEHGQHFSLKCNWSMIFNSSCSLPHILTFNILVIIICPSLPVAFSRRCTDSHCEMAQLLRTVFVGLPERVIYFLGLRILQLWLWGTQWHNCSKHFTTNRKVADSNPEDVIHIFQFT